jgi:hypothetical protein
LKQEEEKKQLPVTGTPAEDREEEEKSSILYL